jgi:hypothetical protein
LRKFLTGSRNQGVTFPEPVCFTTAIIYNAELPCLCDFIDKLLDVISEIYCPLLYLFLNLSHSHTRCAGIGVLRIPREQNKVLIEIEVALNVSNAVLIAAELIVTCGT